MRFVALERHAGMAQHQQDAAEHHRLAHAQPAVGQQPAEHRDAVHQPAVGAEQVQTGLVAEQVVLGQVQQQQRLHPVEGEALPHFGEEADVDALGVTQEIVRAGHGKGSGGHARRPERMKPASIEAGRGRFCGTAARCRNGGPAVPNPVAECTQPRAMRRPDWTCR
ncbi:hypothetical protein D3C71_1481330 [compost metagenome]